MTRLALIAFVALTAQAHADCPAAPDISATMDTLISDARAATSASMAQRASAAMWAEWVRAPDAAAQQMLDEGMQRRVAGDLVGAVTALDALVSYCPDYAEGWNQRAFANFLRGDYAAALPDLDRALALRPRHVAALSGKGLTLIHMGRIADGQAAIRAALEFNPWLNERQFLAIDPQGGPADPSRIPEPVPQIEL